MPVLAPRALFVLAENSTASEDLIDALKKKLKECKITFDLRTAQKLKVTDLLPSAIYFWELKQGSTRSFKTIHSEIERALKGINLSGRYLIPVGEGNLEQDILKLKSVFRDSALTVTEAFGFSKSSDLNKIEKWVKEDHGLFA